MEHRALTLKSLLTVAILPLVAQSATADQSPCTPGFVGFCEDFDPQVNSFCTRVRVTDPDPQHPSVQSDDDGSDGAFLRLTYDGNFSHFSSAAFDLAAPGTFPRIIAEFDFRLGWDSGGTNADGIAFLLIPTSTNGTHGCSKYSHSGLYVERPTIQDTFGVGFDVYGENVVSVCWDGTCLESRDPGFQMDSGEFHRATIDIRSSGNDSLVSVTLIEDVYGAAPGPPTSVFTDFLVEGMQSYENRVDVAGRNGGENMNGDIDNISVRWLVPAVPALSTPGLLLTALLLLLIGQASSCRRRATS